MSLFGWITAAQQAVVLLRQIDVTGLSTASRTELLTLGQSLNEIERLVKEVFEPIKVRLRQEVAGQKDTITIEEGDVRCMITPQSPNVEVRKDADIAALKQKLGPRFYEFFEEVTTYKPRKDFRDRVGSSDPALVTTLMDSVVVNPRTPRVQFKD